MMRPRSCSTISIPLLCILLGAGPARSQLESGRAALEEGRPEEASRLLAAARLKAPRDPATLLLQGMALNAEGQFKKAAEVLELGRRVAPDEIRMRHQLALAYLGLGDDTRARPELVAVFNHAPGTPDIGFHLGRIYHDQGDFVQAEKALSANVSPEPRYAQLAAHYLGLVHERQGRFAAAHETFRHSSVLHPGSSLAILAEKHLAQVDRAHGPERFRLQAQVAGQHDDNVRLAPRTNVFGLRQGRLESAGIFTLIRPEYAIEQDADHELSVHYSGSFVHNFSIDDFDVDDHQLGMTFVKHGTTGGKPSALTLSADHDDVRVGDRQFEKVFTFTPAFTMIHSARSNTTLFGAFSEHEFAQLPAFPQEDRDGHLLLGGALHQILWNDGRESVKLSFHLDRDDTAGQDYDYRGTQPGLGYALTTLGGFSLAADIQYHTREYFQPNAIFRSFRTDHELLTSLRLDHKLDTAGLSLFTSFVRTDNRSSFAVFEYERNVASLGLNYVH